MFRIHVRGDFAKARTGPEDPAGTRGPEDCMAVVAGRKRTSWCLAADCRLEVY